MTIASLAKIALVLAGIGQFILYVARFWIPSMLLLDGSRLAYAVTIFILCYSGARLGI
jgi:hypothetical protein